MHGDQSERLGAGSGTPGPDMVAGQTQNQCGSMPQRMLTADEQEAKKKEAFNALPIEERIEQLRQEIARLGAQFAEVLNQMHSRISNIATQFRDHHHDKDGNAAITRPPNVY